jgi:hypothetical protein
MTSRPPIAVVLVAAVLTAPLLAQPPGPGDDAALEAVLDKAATYVVAYTRDFVGVVAEEAYRQEVRGRAGTDARGFAVEAQSQRRDLKSDVLLVRAPAGDRWIQFRDVFDVDGKPVRDRDDRLSKLFLKPSASAQKQVEDITAESARYNIGGINRNVNLPVLGLTVLLPENRAWFSFSRGHKKDGPAGGTWDIEYREERSGTLIRTTGDQSMPARGRFTIESATGRVLFSQILAENRSLKAQIDVTYAPDAAVGLLVPREMREKYVTPSGSTIEGRATYAKFRRYQVQVEEKVAQPQLTLADVLERAATYVGDFQRQLSGIVAEELYVQDVRMPPSAVGRLSRLPSTSHRELKSDLLLVRPVGADRYIQFRDVFEVDGKPVRDRNERLVKLFLQPSPSTAAQAEQIVDESARYNIGNVQRTVNVPVFALLILDPGNQPRFTFKRTDDGKPAIASDSPPPAAADVWVVRYQEVQPLTMIRTTNGRDLPSHGRFWIDGATGRVLMSELIAEDTFLEGTIDVTYRLDPGVALLVPADMRERYVLRRDSSRVDGRAAYGRFRQFQVKVDEKIAPIK